MAAFSLLLVLLTAVVSGCGTGGGILGSTNVPGGTGLVTAPTAGGGGGGVGTLKVDLVFPTVPAKTVVDFPATSTVVVHVLDPRTHREATTPITAQRPSGAQEMSILVPGLAPGIYDVFVECFDPQGNSAGFSIPQATVVANETVVVEVTGTVTVSAFTVTPPTATIAAGATQQYTATVTFSNNTTADVTYVSTWSAADVFDKATANSNAIATIVPTTGLASGLMAGASQITATLGASSASATLIVTGGPSPSPTPTPTPTPTPLPLLVADYGRQQILSFNEDGTTGWIAYCTFNDTFVGSSQPDNLSNPSSAAHGANGQIYVADTLNNCITRFDKDTGANFTRIPNTAPTAGSALGEFNSPYSVHHSAFDGKIYVADYNNHRLVRFTEGASPVFEEILINGADVNLKPTSVCTDSLGRVYYGAQVDGGARLIGRLPNDWTGSPTPVTFGQAGPGQNPGDFSSYPTGVRVDEQFNIYATDYDLNRVVRFNDNGSGQIANWTTFCTSGSGVGELSGPGGIELMSNDRMMIADTENNRVIITTRMSTTGWTVLGTTGVPATGATSTVPFVFGYPIQY